MVAFTGLGEKIKIHYGQSAASLVTRIIYRFGLPHPKTEEVYVTKEEGRFLVFLDGLGCVLSVRSSERNVPDDPAILKPLQRYIDHGNGINIELFPGVRANIDRQECNNLVDALRNRGILWGDPKPDNAGRVDGQSVVIDLDSFDFTRADMRKIPPRNPAPVTSPDDVSRCHQDAVFQGLKGLLWDAWQPNALPDPNLMGNFWAATRAEVANPQGILIDPIDTMTREAERRAAQNYQTSLNAAQPR